MGHYNRHLMNSPKVEWHREPSTNASFYSIIRTETDLIERWTQILRNNFFNCRRVPNNNVDSVSRSIRTVR